MPRNMHKRFFDKMVFVWRTNYGHFIITVDSKDRPGVSEACHSVHLKIRGRRRRARRKRVEEVVGEDGGGDNTEGTSSQNRL